MGEVTLTINGRSYGIACDNGQEQRVADLGHYVDAKLKDIAKAGAAANESHLLVLTAILLADEVFDLRDTTGTMEQSQIDPEEEEIIVEAIDKLADRIDNIAARIQKA